MKTTTLPTFLALLAASAAVLPAPSSRAAVLPISDASYAGAFTAGTPENITGNATTTGLTTTEGTFTGLFGATANTVITAQPTSSVGTAPTDANAAATSLTINDGVNNLNTGNFQLPIGTFTANTRFFIIESTPTANTAGHPVTVTLLNAANAQVGTYTLTIAAASFTTTAANTTNTALATLSYTNAVAALTSPVQSKLGGVTFSLADFTGSGGDLSTVTGFALNSGTLDPNVVGAFAVPEPGTLTFAAAGLALLALRFRRK